MLPNTFLEHPLHKQLESSNALFKEVYSQINGSSQGYSRNTIQDGFEFLNDRLAQVTPRLVLDHQVASLAELISYIYNELYAFSSDKDPSHIENAAGHVRQAVRQVIDLPVFLKKSTAKIGYGNFFYLAKTKLEKLTLENEKHFEETVNKSKNAAQEAVEAVNEVSEKLEEIKETAKVVDSSFREKLAEFEQRYSNEKSRRETEYASVIEGFSGQATEGINLINNKYEEAKKLLHILSGSSMAGQFETSYKEEKKFADLFRIIGLVLLCFMALLLVFLIGYEVFWKDMPFSLTLVTSRLLIVAALGLPAWYTLSESSAHRKKANKYKMLGLELNALNPYVEYLDSSDAKKIRAEAAINYFVGQPKPRHTKEDESVMSIKTLAEATEPIVKILKAAKS